jgi:hypothetical protein
MLRKLGGRAGAADGAPSSTNDDGSLGADDASSFYDRSTYADNYEGGGPGRNPDAASNSDEPCADFNWPCATPEPEHADGAVPDFACGAHGAKWKSSAPQRYYGRACRVTDCGTGRAAFQPYRNAHK